MGNMMKAYVIHSNGQIEALDLADGATEALHVAVSEDIDEIPFTSDARFLVDPWAKFKALNPNTVANEIYRALGPDLVEGDYMAAQSPSSSSVIPDRGRMYRAGSKWFSQCPTRHWNR